MCLSIHLRPDHRHMSQYDHHTVSLIVVQMAPMVCGIHARPRRRAQLCSKGQWRRTTRSSDARRCVPDKTIRLFPRPIKLSESLLDKIITLLLCAFNMYACVCVCTVRRRSERIICSSLRGRRLSRWTPMATASWTRRKLRNSQRSCRCVPVLNESRLCYDCC